MSEVSDLDPESRVLEPVQKKIEAQLRRNLEELTLNLHETANEARMVKQRREDIGVELYNVQQHLAKLQESLERGHDNFVAVQKLRQEREKEREELLSQCKTVESALGDLNSKHSKYQVELDKLSETLMKVEQFNQQIQSEIQIERTAAYKAEDEIVRLEREKARQDMLVDHLNERIRALSEQEAQLASQLASQRSETKTARDTLAEALSEMEGIRFENKQLLQQWKTSLIGMQRRDEALRTTEEALEEQKEQLMSLDNEIIGYRQSIKVAQQNNARLSSLLSKTENEVSMLEKQIESMLQKKTKASERYKLLKDSLEKVEAENHTLEQDTRGLTSQIEAIVKKSQKAAKDVIDMENRVLDALNKQTTLKKSSQSALVDIEKMKSVIRDKELHVTNMENELARIRVDTLQTQAHNEVLKETVTELEKELKSRDTLIEKMQVDIRRKHDEIERKQKALDALNRQFDGIIATQGADDGEHVGPLEATINNLSKSITQKSQENGTLQRDWIKLQTELVNSKNQNNELRESIQELRAQCTILTQKKQRMLNQTRQQSEAVSALEKNTHQMHLEMKKLNTLIASNAQAQDAFANENYLLEGDLVKRLQERKREALQLEEKIDDIRRAKAELLAEILDSERNVMVWEKKIQIAKETELALDPTVGKDEIHRMQREIYIMEQRFANLKREQKRKVEEMEKLVEHRDVLRTKGQAIQAATKAGQKGVTKVTVLKDNNRLAQELNDKKKDAQQKEKQIRDCLANTEQTALEAEKVTQEIEDLQREMTQLQRRLAVQTQERNRTMDEKARKQRTLQRFRDAEKGLYKLATSPEQIAQEQNQLEVRKRALMVVMQDMAELYPAMASELQDLQSAL